MLHNACSWISPCGLVWKRCTAYPDLTHTVRPRSRQIARHSVSSCDKISMAQNDPDLLPMLSDAHCHPQLDPAHLQAVPHLRCGHLAAMSVSYDVDWDIMLQLHKLAGRKVIPGFGIHPWWSHLHGSSAGSTWQQLLEASGQDQIDKAISILSQHDPVTNSGAYATNRPAKPDVNNSSSSISSEAASQCIQANSQDEQQQTCLGNGLRVVPLEEWEGRLRQLLEKVPSAVVGEIGIDRAATIPGSKAKTSLQHQLALLKMQIALAAEFGRPVSVHCVRGYGHLLQLFSELSATPAGCPPKVMLHSYGGSVDEIPKFCKLRNIGDRFYFSFSHAINNMKTPDKLAARIAAVPDGRLLVESDQVSPLVIEDGMLHICQVVASVKGWSLQHAVQQLSANFNTFYEHQLKAL